MIRLLALTLTLSTLVGCGRLEKAYNKASGTGAVLASNAQAHCFGWPEQQFDSRNRAKVSTKLKAGDRAVDVTLRTTSGGKTSVGELLANGKPLLLVTASLTCPVFQEKHPELGKTIRKYGDRLTVASVYLIEAHPSAPDPGPYKGKVSTHEFSDRRQAMTLEQRLSNAREVKRQGSEVIVVDDLSKGNENPFWCTWGTCANCAYLVKTDGTLAAVHDWYDPASMEGSIAALLGP